MQNKIQVNIAAENRNEILLQALWLLAQIRANSNSPYILKIYEKQADKLLEQVGVKNK